MIWPSVDKPDVVLSVGTGYVAPADSPALRFLHGIFTDGFCSRAFRAFILSPSIHSENSWHMCLDSLSDEDRADFFRLNFPMDGGDVELDDAGQMAPLLSKVGSYVEATSPFVGMVQALWTSNFYFELDQRIDYVMGHHVCRGAILSRSENCSALIRRIRCKYPAAAFVTNSGVLLGKLNDEACCRLCGFYRLPVQLDVRFLTETVSILLQFHQSVERRISGFPTTMSWIGNQQGIDRVFGRSDHQERFVIQNCNCKCKKRPMPSSRDITDI